MSGEITAETIARANVRYQKMLAKYHKCINSLEEIAENKNLTEVHIRILAEDILEQISHD